MPRRRWKDRDVFWTKNYQVRAGKASPKVLDDIMVVYYGNPPQQRGKRIGARC